MQKLERKNLEKKNLGKKRTEAVLFGRKKAAAGLGLYLFVFCLLCPGVFLETETVPVLAYAEELEGKESAAEEDRAEVSAEKDPALIALNGAAVSDMAAVSSAYQVGTRIFDGAELFSAEEEAQLSSEASALSEKAGFGCIVFTMEDAAGFSGAEDLADFLYENGSFGTGEARSGAMLLIDMDHREYFVYTRGTATRYLTDSVLTELTEDRIAPALSEGEFAEAAEGFLSETAYAVDLGIQEGQYDYNSETGKRDAARVKPARKLELWELIAAALLSGIIGYLPCRSIQKSYAMEAEKRMAKGFALSWRAEAGFRFAEQAPEARLLNRSVSSVPIVVPRNHGNRSGRGGMGSFGGGRSTLRMGRCGGLHGGRGGKF